MASTRRTSKTTFTATEVGAILEDLRSQFHTFGETLTSLVQKVDNIEAQVALHTEQITGINLRLTSIESRLTNVEDRLDKIENRLDKIESRLDTLEKEFHDFREESRGANLPARVLTLEQKVANLN